MQQRKFFLLQHCRTSLTFSFHRHLQLYIVYNFLFNYERDVLEKVEQNFVTRCKLRLFVRRPIQRDNNRGAKGIVVKPSYKGVVGQPVEFIGKLQLLNMKCKLLAHE